MKVAIFLTPFVVSIFLPCVLTAYNCTDVTYFSIIYPPAEYTNSTNPNFTSITNVGDLKE